MYNVFGVRTDTRKLDTQTIINRTRKIAEQNNVEIQLFDARFIFGADHITTAIDHAKRAIDLGKTISDSLSMEILLYASGEYQIKNAIAKLGLREDTMEIAIVIISDNDFNLKIQKMIDQLFSELGFRHDDRVINGDKKYLEQYGINKDELLSVPEARWFELVLEKVALVDIKK